MAEIKTYSCDRCKNQLSDTELGNRANHGNILLYFDTRSSIYDRLSVDLCGECIESLNNWFSNFK